MEKFTHILAGMMDKEMIRGDDPVMPAFACTAPASVLIHPCDRERPKTEEAIRKIEAFSRHFAAAYGKE